MQGGKRRPFDKVLSNLTDEFESALDMEVVPNFSIGPSDNGLQRNDRIDVRRDAQEEFPTFGVNRVQSRTEGAFINVGARNVDEINSEVIDEAFEHRYEESERSTSRDEQRKQLPQMTNAY
jgi:hypothetical protein